MNDYRPRILIAEDDPTFQNLLRRLLETAYDVVDAVADGRAALESIEKHQPDLVFMDISMPIMSGFVAMSHLRATHAHVKTIIITAHTEPVYVEEAFRRGASAYVLKSALSSELFKAVERVLAGETFQSSRLSA